jgi:hypothetical protein
MVAPVSLISAIRELQTGGEFRAVRGFLAVPYWALQVAGAEAFTIWRHFRDRVDQTGYWPVIIGDHGAPEFGGSDGTLVFLVDNAQRIQHLSERDLQFVAARRSPAEVLQAAGDLPFERWVERQRDPAFQASEHLRKASYFDRIEGAGRLACFHREWAERWRQQPPWRFDTQEYVIPPRENRNPPQHDLHCVKSFDVEQCRHVLANSVVILLVPTRFPWEVPAYLWYSTMADERPAQVHVGALKWLWDRFGAQLVGVMDRVLEVIPQSRPGMTIDALQAAAAIAAYSNCPITSENELASIPELAVYLMESEYWSFCWP